MLVAALICVHCLNGFCFNFNLNCGQTNKYTIIRRQLIHGKLPMLTIKNKFILDSLAEKHCIIVLDIKNKIYNLKTRLKCERKQLSQRYVLGHIS